MREERRIRQGSAPPRTAPAAAAAAGRGRPAPLALLRRAARGGPPLTHADALQLQRTVGNGACQGLLAVSPPPLQRWRRLTRAQELVWKQGENDRKKTLRLLGLALIPLGSAKGFDVRPLRKRLFSLRRYSGSPRGLVDNWISTVGAFVQDVYAELVVAGKGKGAEKLQQQLDSQLKSYAKLIYKPRRGQPRTSCSPTNASRPWSWRSSKAARCGSRCGTRFDCTRHPTRNG